MAERRRSTFGPAVVVGLASGALVAVAGNQAWAKAAEGQGIGEQVASVSVAVGEAKAPLATALALVALAGWGVLLVTRGRFRWVISVVVTVVAAGLLAAVVGAVLAAPDAVRDAYEPYGVTDIDVTRTVWNWLALVGAMLSLGAAAIAVRDVRSWPQMGRRYDAPGAAEVEADPAERSNLDLWKAMDEGRDPTD